MSKQTAVEWLVEKIQQAKPSFKFDGLIRQAKEMEKQQIIDAFAECWKANMPDGFECKLSAKDYYKGTFNQD